MVLIGQAPARVSPEPWHYAAPSTKRLAAVMRCEPELIRSIFEARNLLTRYPGKIRRERSEGPSDRFPWTRARRAAKQMTSTLAGRDVVIVGARVARCFGLVANVVGYLKWFHDAELDARVAIMPHPSGLNRWWNDLENQMAAKRFLLRAIGE